MSSSDASPTDASHVPTCNPILIEVTRGARVESVHRGSLALATPSGHLVLAIGDVQRPVFARSAVKAMQCLPLIESGAADRFGFANAEIALACASHTGTERHVALAASMLERIRLGERDLGCGAHAPMSPSAAAALIRSGASPSQLHNNCSGKHAGMLATAVHLEEPARGYWEVDHPVQRRIRRAMAELSGLELGADMLGIDGCSVPTWAMPLASMAAMFATLVTGEGLATERRAAVERILAACWAEPELVAGPGRADTNVMRRLPGRIFMKTGAEGVYCGGFPGIGLGFALKIDDGATRASAGATIALIERVLPDARGLADRSHIRNWRGADVGLIRTSPELERALDGLKL